MRDALIAKINRVIRVLVVTLLVAYFGPTAVKSSPKTEPTLDEVMQAAKAAIAIINQNIKTKNEEILSLITQMQALNNQRTGEDAAIAERLKSKLDRIAKAIAKLNEQTPTLIEEIRKVDEEISRLEEQKEKAIEELSEQKRKAVAAFKEAMGNARARSILAAISQDRIKAAKFIQFVRGNSRTALSEMLKRESPGSDVDVREVKDTNGLLLLFRIGDLTHCLSTKQQCGGKPYSVTR